MSRLPIGVPVALLLQTNRATLHIPAMATRMFFTRTFCTQAKPDVLYRLVQLECRGHDQEVLRSYQKFVTLAAKELDITVGEANEPWRFIRRRTLLRSAFVKKKHRVQYEWRTYFNVMQFKYLTGSTADTFLEYVERNVPEGVLMRVTRHQLEELAEHLTSPPPQAASIES